MELQKAQKTGLQIANGEAIAKSIYKINFAMSYPLTEKQTEEWAKCIYSLRPETTKEELESVIRGILLGEIQFEASRGIRDIFKALEEKSNIPAFKNDPDQWLKK